MPKLIMSRIKILELAQLAVKSAKERFNMDLDFSIESLTLLDDLLSSAQKTFDQQRQEGTISEEAVLRTARIWGCYYGEVILREWGGRWILEGDDVLMMLSNYQIDPVAAILKNINSHPRPSIIEYYLKIEAAMKPETIQLPPSISPDTSSLVEEHEPTRPEPDQTVTAAVADIPEKSPRELDPQQAAVDELREYYKGEQNLPVGVAAGVFTGIAGAIPWALISFLVDRSINWMAVLLGVLIGWSIRETGRGVEKKFGIFGAFITFICILFANILAAAMFIAKTEAISLLKVISGMVEHPGMVVDTIKIMFSPFDIVYFLLALGAGYYFAFRRITTADLKRVK